MLNHGFLEVLRKIKKVCDGGVAGRDSSGVWGGHVYTAIFKMENQQGQIVWNSAQYAAAWMGGGLAGGWIHVYVWLSPFAVPLKLSTTLLIGYTYKIKKVKKKKKERDL